MRVGYHSISQLKKRFPTLELPRLNKRSSRMSNQSNSNKANVLQELFINFENSSVNLINQHYENMLEPNELRNSLSNCSTKFAVFQNTVFRLNGSNISNVQKHKTGLVSVDSAVKSSFSPFINFYKDFNQRLAEEWKFMHRKVSADVGALTNEFSTIVQNSGIDISSGSRVYLSINRIKESFDQIFHSNIQDGHSLFLSTLDEIFNLTKSNYFDDFKNKLTILFQTSVSWVLCYNAIISAKDDFQDLLNDYITKFEFQDISKAQKTSSSLPSTNSNTARYIPGISLDEIIDNGALALEQYSPDFFSDLREAVAKYKSEKEKIISEQRKEIEKLKKYQSMIDSIILHQKEDLGLNDEETFHTILDKLDTVYFLQEENFKLKNELSVATKNYENSLKETEAYKEDNMRISNLNSHQNDRYSSFLAKMAQVIGSEAKEEDLLAALAKRKEEKNKVDEKDDIEFLSKIVGEKGDKETLCAKIEEFKNFFVKKLKLKENPSLNLIIEIEKSNLEEKSSPVPNKYPHLNVSQQESVSDDDLQRIFGPLLEVIKTTSKVEPNVYLPEICNAFIQMNNSLQEISNLSDNFEVLFTNTEFKLPSKETDEYEKVKKCCNSITADFNKIDKSQMNPSVFNVISRFVVFIGALSTAL